MSTWGITTALALHSAAGPPEHVWRIGTGSGLKPDGPGKHLRVIVLFIVVLARPCSVGSWFPDQCSSPCPCIGSV